MSVKIRQLVENDPGVLLRGNFACAGCGLTVAYRHAIAAIERPIVVIPACCASVVQSTHPNVAYAVPTLNIAFAAHASAASGIARAIKMRGEEATVVVWSGDGGTYDIGLATLSGAAERNEDMIYFCYDNGFYSNTGSQRSSASPRGVVTTTTPKGKKEGRKSIARIVAAHDVPYIATATTGYPRDLIAKVRRATSIEGFRFILIDAPCPTGWYSDPALTPALGKLAVKTGYFPMFEVEHGKLTFTKKFAKYRDPKTRLHIEEYMKLQGRFKAMTPQQTEELQTDLQHEWDMLARLE